MKLFNSALMFQRAGIHEDAARDYELFLSVAKEVGAPEEAVAEVHVNLGQCKARLGDRKAAKHHFMEALEKRDLATARVNLALLILADGQSREVPGTVLVSSLQEAIDQCNSALKVVDKNDERTRNTAERIIRDAMNALPTGYSRG
jgi:tetratricopeptide (TPR) repeat protein